MSNRKKKIIINNEDEDKIRNALKRMRNVNGNYNEDEDKLNKKNTEDTSFMYRRHFLNRFMNQNGEEKRESRRVMFEEQDNDPNYEPKMIPFMKNINRVPETFSTFTSKQPDNLKRVGGRRKYKNSSDAFYKAKRAQNSINPHMFLNVKKFKRDKKSLGQQFGLLMKSKKSILKKRKKRKLDFIAL